MFLDKLGEVSKHEQYSKAAKHPQIRPREPNELLLDHEFCRLFKALEGLVGKSVSPKMDFLNGAEVPDSVLVLQYKELIRDQDNKLQEMEKELERLKNHEKSSTQRLEELQSTVQQLKDENVVLRAHVSSSGGDVSFNEEMSRQLEFWKNESERWKKEYSNVCFAKDEQIRRLVSFGFYRQCCAPSITWLGKINVMWSHSQIFLLA